MFKDLALMVEQQGEMLNNIEKNVDMSRDYVAEAETELVKAKEYVQTTRKVPLISIIHGFVFDSFDIPGREGPSGLSYFSSHFSNQSAHTFTLSDCFGNSRSNL
jgi:hypothetical protein